MGLLRCSEGSGGARRGLGMLRGILRGQEGNRGSPEEGYGGA